MTIQTLPATLNLNGSSTNAYDPRLSQLMAQAETDWGDPQQNLKQIIRYNMGDEFDRAMWGVDLIDGELITIQAPKKARKSTFLANLVISFAAQLKERGLWLAIDTLESGMTPRAYRDVLTAIVATRLLISDAVGSADRSRWPSASSLENHPRMAEQAPLRITRKFLRFGMRTYDQNRAIKEAMKYVAGLPITIFGSSQKEGEARDIKKGMERWSDLYHGDHGRLSDMPHRIFCVDNVQQYREFAGNSYYGLEIITNDLSNFLTSHPGSVVIAVSQVSLGSVRLNQQSSGESEMEVRGGSRLAEESVTVFQTRYDKKNPSQLIIETPFSRYEPPPTMIQEIEPYSGTFLSPAKPLIKE